jgi:hypothetical protein
MTGDGTDFALQSRAKCASVPTGIAADGLPVASGRREYRKATMMDHRLRLTGRLSAACLLLALTGCATTRFAPTYCLQHDQMLPSEPEKVGPKLTGRADEDTRILAGSAIRLRAWGRGLADILEHCREPQH